MKSDFKIKMSVMLGSASLTCSLVQITTQTRVSEIKIIIKKVKIKLSLCLIN
jgi:hypothetical protein